MSDLEYGDEGEHEFLCLDDDDDLDEEQEEIVSFEEFSDSGSVSDFDSKNISGEDEDDNDHDDNDDEIDYDVGEIRREGYNDDKENSSVALNNMLGLAKRIDYEALTWKDLLKKLKNDIDQIVQVLNISEDDCCLLLQYFNWNKGKMMESFMDNNEKTNDNAGLNGNDFIDIENRIKQAEKGTLCPICCMESDNEINPLLIFSLPCGHGYCIDCYIRYIKDKIFANNALIKCPEYTCKLNLKPYRDIKMISDYMVENKILPELKIKDENITKENGNRSKTNNSNRNGNNSNDYDWSSSEDEDEDENENEQGQYREGRNFKTSIYKKNPFIAEPKTLFEKYEENLIKIYVENHSNYKWCPSPDCKGLVLLENYSKNYLKELSTENKNNLIPIVSCPFDHSFCFLCNFENHLPVPCWAVRLWIQKCKDDSETAKWIDANTKQCPKCESAIEKNGGCNHMTCKKCRYDFCWICLGVWSSHNNSYYNCSKYNEEGNKEVRNKQENSKKSLQRYLHYYNHFISQESSMKGDNMFCSDIENKIMKIHENVKDDVSWIELQFYKDSVNTLLKCRRTLKWSYALIYYLNSSNFTSILTDNQLYLSNSVEKLSKLFEIFKPEEILNKKLEFINVSNYLLKREKALIECAIDGINNGGLTFSVNHKGHEVK